MRHIAEVSINCIYSQSGAACPIMTFCPEIPSIAVLSLSFLYGRLLKHMHLQLPGANAVSVTRGLFNLLIPRGYPLVEEVSGWYLRVHRIVCLLVKPLDINNNPLDYYVNQVNLIYYPLDNSRILLILTR